MSKNTRNSHKWSHRFARAYAYLVTPRTIILFIVLLAGISMLGYGYISAEYITNKGPDDVKTQEYVASYMRQKFSRQDGNNGSFRMGIRITGFRPDNAQGKSGWYSIDGSYNSHKIAIRAYFNGSDFSNWSDSPR